MYYAAMGLKRTTLHLEEQQIKRLAVIGKRGDRPVAYLVRLAIEKYLAEVDRKKPKRS